jgi:hypothetical protein
MLRPRSASTVPADLGSVAADAETPPMGFRPPLAGGATPLPGRSAPLATGEPLPKRFPDRGIPLPRRRPALPSDAPLDPDPATADVAAQRAIGGSTPPPAPATVTPAVEVPLPPPRVPLAAAAPSSLPTERDDAGWPPRYHRPTHRTESAAHRADQQPAPAGTTPALPVPTIPAPPLAAAQRVSGPAMNDRVAGRIAEMLRREAKRDNRSATS